MTERHIELWIAVHDIMQSPKTIYIYTVVIFMTKFVLYLRPCGWGCRFCPVVQHGSTSCQRSASNWMMRLWVLPQVTRILRLYSWITHVCNQGMESHRFWCLQSIRLARALQRGSLFVPIPCGTYWKCLQFELACWLRWLACLRKAG